MTLLSTALTAKLAEFGVRVLISLGIKFNDGPFHRWSERTKRKHEIEDMKKEMAK
jgi:hypothetical protein